VDAKLNKWISALDKADKYFNEAIVEHREEILDLNVAQLEVGKDSLGQFLDDYASDAYAEYKQSIGSKAPLGTPDLILEGDFTEGFVLKGGNGEWFITSTDEKKDRLRDKYGEDIFGLSDDSLNEIRTYILESFLIRLRNGML